MTGKPEKTLEIWVKVMGPLLGVAAFVWGIYTYQNTTDQQNIRIAETRRVEASRPFLEMQLKLYAEIAKTTSVIATSDNEINIKLATRRFNELYYGELALVERDKVIRAMIAFKKALDGLSEDANSQKELGRLALSLVKACRLELAESWGTDAWDR